jgi:hypothetical protein
VWTSAKAPNAQAMLDVAFPGIHRRLDFVWSQAECTNLQPPDKLPQFQKPVGRIFAQFPHVGREDVLIVDDSPEKFSADDALHHLAIPPFSILDHAVDYHRDDALLRLRLWLQNWLLTTRPITHSLHLHPPQFANHQETSSIQVDHSSPHLESSAMNGALEMTNRS